jgi:hypothetical protein
MQTATTTMIAVPAPPNATICRISEPPIQPPAQPEYHVYEIEYDRAVWHRVKTTVVAQSPFHARRLAMWGNGQGEEVLRSQMTQRYVLDDAPLHRIRPATPEELPARAVYVPAAE